jgi:hypothetical protein
MMNTEKTTDSMIASTSLEGNVGGGASDEGFEVEWYIYGPEKDKA